MGVVTMNLESINQVYRMLGITKTKVSHKGWVSGPCPFARWTHEGGTDSRASFALLVQDPGASRFKCFACNKRGPAIDLAFMLAKTSNKEPNMDIAKLCWKTNLVPFGGSKRVEAPPEALELIRRTYKRLPTEADMVPDIRSVATWGEFRAQVATLAVEIKALVEPILTELARELEAYPGTSIGACPIGEVCNRLRAGIDAELTNGAEYAQEYLTSYLKSVEAGEEPEPAYAVWTDSIGAHPF